MDLQSVYSDYRRWVRGQQDRFRSGNSVRPSATATAASLTGQPQPGSSPGRPQSNIKPDPEISEFRRNEDAFDYRRFSKYASEASKQRDASRPENSAPLSCYRQDYRGQLGQPAMSARPPDRLKVSTCPFVPSTEYQDQFRAWQVIPSYPRRETYSRPTQRMDLQTSYAQDFKGLQRNVTASAKPTDNLRPGISPIGVPTEYENKWLVPPPQRFRPEYVPLKGKMDFSTSYGQDFKAQDRSMRFLILPRDQIRMPQGAFQHKTTYNSDYAPMSAWGL